jgi:hypothetical protein
MTDKNEKARDEFFAALNVEAHNKMMAAFEEALSDHDAVPEAIAYADGEPAPKCGGEAGLSPRDGTGNTQKPVAWARFFPNGGPQSVYLDRPPHDAKPLYRSPTLTDAERAAIEFFVGFHNDGYGLIEKHADTLRKLLERLT